MNRAKLIIIGIVVAALLSLLVIPRPNRPLTSYQGHTVQEWAARAASNDPKAIRALHAMGARATAELEAMLRSKDSVRTFLWKLRPKLPARLAGFIQKHVGPPNTLTRHEQAAHALGVIGPAAAGSIPSLLACLESNESRLRWVAAAALAGIGPASTAPLVKLLGSSTPELRWSAAYALGQMTSPPEAAIPALVGGLRDSEERVRLACAYTLSRMGASGLIAIFEFRDDSTGKDREFAAKLINDFPESPRAAIPELIRRANSTSENDRARAIRVLSELRPVLPDTIKCFSASLDDLSPQVQMAAIAALASIGSRARPALPALMQVAETRTEPVRSTARELVAHLNESKPDNHFQ